ncbi:MAG TPA: hypothetical protein VNI84_00390 [Pyrinomonadaceae bacterium]|nr:hypothetical protein [Pyrinomonadaceae bacterium]
MKNTIFTKSAIVLFAVFAFVSIAAAQTPTVGRYTGIQTGTQTSFGEPAAFDLIILAGGKYEQNNETGKFSFDAKTGKIEFLSGAMPKDWVGFFYKAGDKFSNGGEAKYDTIVIRDKKDVADGNMRDLFWYNCCAK